MSTPSPTATPVLPPEEAWDSARRQVGAGLLSVVMPAHNLGPRIAANVREVAALFRGRVPFEVIVSDDGSTDHTRAELERAAEEVPELRPLRLHQNAGKGAALIRGFLASRGSHVLFLDADLDLPPAQAWRFFETMEREGADVVIGSKLHPQSSIGTYPWHRRLSSAVYYALVKILVGLPVRDTQTGLKLFRRAVLEWTVPRMLVKRFAVDLELLAVAHERGFRIAECPVALTFRGTWGALRPTAVRQVLNDTLAIFYRLRILRYYQTIRDFRAAEPPPRVSVIIACPAPSGYLDEALAGLAQQTLPPHEVIVLPDAPTGRAWPAGVREVPTGRCRPAEKRNLGVREARGDVVALLDDDTFPSEDWIERAVVYFSEPSVAAVGGPATTPYQDPYLAQMGGRVYANRTVSGGYRYRYVPERVREVDDFPSCNLFVRTDVMRELGGFRTDFWPGEDTYLCLEITRRLRRRIFYDPRVHVYHHRRPLFLPHLRQVGRYALHRGYFARHFPETSRRLSYALPSIFVAGLVAGAALTAVWPPLGFVYFPALIFYAAVTFLSCAASDAAGWLLVWAGVVLTHAVYGVRFAQGLTVRRLPGEVRRFDHPSEKDAAAADRGGPTETR